MPYALFDGDKKIGATFPTERDVWMAALSSGLVSDLPVSDEAGGQVIPRGYHVMYCADEELNLPAPAWRLPHEIS